MDKKKIYTKVNGSIRVKGELFLFAKDIEDDDFISVCKGCIFSSILNNGLYCTKKDNMHLFKEVTVLCPADSDAIIVTTDHLEKLLYGE